MLQTSEPYIRIGRYNELNNLLEISIGSLRKSSLFTGIVFKFHIHVHIKQKDRICIRKDPRLNLRDMLITG